MAREQSNPAFPLNSTSPRIIVEFMTFYDLLSAVFKLLMALTWWTFFKKSKCNETANG